MRTITMLFLACALALAPLSAARAQDAQAGGYPQTLDAQNPYAQGLQQAKQAYDDSVKRYEDAAARAYWSWEYYEAYYRAYYEVWAAYTRYYAYLRYYWWMETEQTFPGRIVTEGTGAPVAGATVTLMSHVPPRSGQMAMLLGTKTTGADGRFRFDNVSPNTYTFSVVRDGYDMVRSDVQVTRGMTTLEVPLHRTAGVSGVVTARPLHGAYPANPPAGWNDPQPLSGVKVSLYRTDVQFIRAPGPDRVATTGADGRFSFDGVSFSSARVVFEATNYTTASRDVQLSAGPASLSVLMEYNGPPVPVAAPGFDDLNRR